MSTFLCIFFSPLCEYLPAIRSWIDFLCDYSADLLNKMFKFVNKDQTMLLLSAIKHCEYSYFDYILSEATNNRRETNFICALENNHKAEPILNGPPGR